MHVSTTPFPTHHHTTESADVRSFARGDVMWDRPIFKAPPLELDPRFVDSEHFARELRRMDAASR